MSDGDVKEKNKVKNELDSGRVQGKGGVDESYKCKQGAQERSHREGGI